MAGKFLRFAISVLSEYRAKIVIPYNDGSLHDVDFRLYYYQPVEIDARNFADDVIKRLEEKGAL